MEGNRLASGLLLVLLGIWLIMQAVAGDLARRLLSWGNPPPVNPTPGSGLGGATGRQGRHPRSGSGEN